MNSTYKLIGQFWDHRDEARLSSPITFDASYSDIHSPANLFDIHGKRRFILLSLLFNLKNESESSLTLAGLSDCTSVAILVDCYPLSKGVVQKQFFRHRVLQVLEYIRNALSSAVVELMFPLRAREQTCALSYLNKR